MAIGFVEMQGQITRAQDFTAIKHNDDTKSMVQQANFGQQMTKQSSRSIMSANLTPKIKEAMNTAVTAGNPEEINGSRSRSRTAR